MSKSEVENIDCMIGMSMFPNKYFDLAIVDPEYGIGTMTNQTPSIIETGRLYETSCIELVKDKIRRIKRRLREETGINMGLLDEQISLEKYLIVLEYWKRNL